MANGSGNGGLYFIVGMLCVVVAIGAFLLFGGHLSAPQEARRSADVTIQIPKADPAPKPAPAPRQ